MIIIVAMASGHLDGHHCPHCKSAKQARGFHSAQVYHLDTCPVALARKILREQGTSVCEYQMTFLWDSLGRATQGWMQVISYSEEEAIAGLQRRTQGWDVPIRNIHIEKALVLP
jgi:hypothetical protein